MRTKIKICGIKTLEEASLCQEAGADYLGFNFVRTSSRYINPGKAKNITEKLSSGRAETVGVFRDEPLDKVLKIAKDVPLDLIQLHGHESTGYCKILFHLRIIKVFGLSDLTCQAMENYPVEFFLLDREVQGEGKAVDFSKAARLSRKFPLILAGGMTAENVCQAVSIVKPYAVDAASGVETNGRKDLVKIKKFIYQVNLSV